ncbi:hypothetical protein [Actinophytocola xanthii]|uniref:Uncharacterized protein n=1 Tax=Actinophytocola xanthii TaxID=1912961 RepID=A0A1Q8CY28_9PSEU|nr:hypothetical protein [Actinophytocola xanthii]OLF19250.1 hypothetical protein BU204_02550 [Actinophytocola xanthii]
MTDIEAQQVDELLTTIRNLELPPRQRELLDAIVKVAGDIQDTDDPAYSSEFRDSFRKEQAELVLEYVRIAEGAAVSSTLPGAAPARIVRRPSPPPGIVRSGPGQGDDDDS